jgi:AcrR family transcriptional regulator
MSKPQIVTEPRKLGKKATKAKKTTIGGDPPKQRDPIRTSAAVLAAATLEFRDKGFAGARIDAIAARAGVNKRMLYHYFGDKEGLYLAVLESAYVGIRSAEGKLRLTEQHPEHAMRELALFTWKYFIDHPEFLSLLQTENLMKARFLTRSARIFDLHSPLIAQIAKLLESGAELGCFRRDADPVNIYISIAALGFFYLTNRFTLATIFQRNLMTADALEAWGEHMADMVIASLRPCAP